MENYKISMRKRSVVLVECGSKNKTIFDDFLETGWKDFVIFVDPLVEFDVKAIEGTIHHLRWNEVIFDKDYEFYLIPYISENVLVINSM
jgi:hypothetical protein